MEDEIIKTAIGLMTPVLEGSIIVAAEYVKACKRGVITSRDVEYSMKYCARNMVGKHIGTMFPDMDLSDESGSEMESEDSCSDSEEQFTRYDGVDEVMLSVNQAYDTWNTWVPVNMTESMLRDSINKAY